MYKVNISPHWQISKQNAPALDTTVLIGLLQAIKQFGSIAAAAEQAKLSYRYAWGIVRDFEAMFEAPLITTNRGRGTVLTELAEQLIWANQRIMARLSPTFESLSSELEHVINLHYAHQSAQIRIHASHGFAVAALLGLLSEQQITVDLMYRNSTDAVAALARKECDLAGFHVPLGQYEQPAAAQFMQSLQPDTHCLIHLAMRSQGLMVKADNPQQIKDISDLTRQTVRFVNRQKGSGTRMLLELMLAEKGIAPSSINGFENSEFTHSAVAAFIASGMADCGFGVQTAAHRFGLAFIPLVRERYFFAVPNALLEDARLQPILATLRSPIFHQQVNLLAGYDALETGKISSLTEAFGPL